jgi:uncharacterized protein YxjI
MFKKKSSTLHLYQNNEKFEVLAQNKKDLLYKIERKGASKTILFKVVEPIENKDLSIVKKHKVNPFIYLIQSSSEEEIASVNYKKGVDTIKDKVIIKHVNETFESNISASGKVFDFKDIKNRIIFTVDKKMFKLKDSYTIEIHKEVNVLIPIGVVLILDDIFHPN